MYGILCRNDWCISNETNFFTNLEISLIFLILNSDTNTEHGKIMQYNKDI